MKGKNKGEVVRGHLLGGGEERGCVILLFELFSDLAGTKQRHDLQGVVCCYWGAL